MPRFSFDNKITLGNIIQIGIICFGMFAAYFTLVGNDQANANGIIEANKDIASIQAAAASLQTTTDSLNIRMTVADSRAETGAKQLADVVSSVSNLVMAINQDRLNSGRNDAEIRKDVGYLREWVEEQKRRAK